MRRSNATSEELRDKQRARILDAARSVFSRKGPSATMDDIATAANVSHGLAYRYFPDKDTIFQALVDEAIKAGPANLSHLEPAPGNPEDRLAFLVASLIESRRRQPEFYLLLDHVQNSAATPKKLKDQLRLRKEAFFSLLKHLIVEGQARGKVHSGDPDQLVIAMGAVLEGLTRIALHEPEKFKKSCPEPEMILRILIPSQAKEKSGAKR